MKTGNRNILTKGNIGFIEIIFTLIIASCFAMAVFVGLKKMHEDKIILKLEAENNLLKYIIKEYESKLSKLQ